MSDNKSSYWVLAYYHFTNIDDPQTEVNLHKSFLSSLNATCRIYISKEGINGQMSAVCADAQIYMDWMKQRPEFSNLQFKIHSHHEQVFPRLTIKVRKQLVAIDVQVNLANTGEHLSPKKWREMLCETNKILLDVRNDYEWEIGRFEGAELPPCETFRDFCAYADQLKEKVSLAETPIMMYCTGGIRCELYSALLKEKGFQKVYQLNGGVIGYGLEEGSDHWQGKLFVFDDRLAVPISETTTQAISHCRHCGSLNDNYYNCANMDCNVLFLCCAECLKKFLGCCQSSCLEAPRRRPYHQETAHKPFKRAHHYQTDIFP